MLTQWYPPEPMKLLSDMAESLQALGHDVTVLTGFPNWPSGKVYPGYRIRVREKETMGGIPIIRIPLYPNHSNSSAKRILNFVSFIVSASVLGPWFVRRPHVIHTIQPTTTCLPAWILSRLWSVPYTYEVQDMWPETLRATGMVNGERALSIVAAYCNWVYKRAAAIRVISPGFRANLIDKGVPPEKIHFIPNWVDTDFYGPQAPNGELADQLCLAGHFNVMYAGTIGLAQGIETVLDAAVLLRDLPRIQFVLVGDGVELHRLQECAQVRDIKNVKFLGRYPMDAMSALYALADVLLVHLKDDPLFRMTIPHKTLTYLAAGKPVLAALEGDVADVVRNACAGLVCASGNPQALADTVRRFYNMSAVERNALGLNGRRAACELYSRDYLVGQIAEMLEAVVTRSRTKGRLLASSVSHNEKL